MGLVYRAYHTELERTGAVKVMQAITPDADTVARFRHEAQAIAKLRHPNIVDVYDFGEFQGTPYMIVEYVPGGSLAGTMTHGPLDQATALKYLRGIAAGLDYAHVPGVMPCDGEGLMELLFAHLHRLPPAASSRSAALGTELDGVLMKGLAKDPAARWGSATEFVGALEASLTAPPAKVLTTTMVMAPP